MTHDRSLAVRSMEVAAEPDRIRTVADAMRARLVRDASGHDLDHAWRVYLLGTQLADETGADETVVQPAALSHDLHRIMGDPGDYVHPADSVGEVKELLERAGYDSGAIDAVSHCVVVHDEYDFRGMDQPPETIEAEVLRDADNLDAMGAVGIARDFAFTGVVGNSLWDPTGDRYSGLGHFEDKLLYLVDEMHTDAARELAVERHAFLETFKERFEREWYGNA